MAKRQLSKLDLSQELKEKLAKAQFKTIEDVLCVLPVDLMRRLLLSYNECQSLLKHLFSFCVPPHQTALSMYENEYKRIFPLKGRNLNNILHGGLHSGMLTEFAGPAGVGKTQWCLQLTVLSALRNTEDNCGVIYIDTESAFRSERLIELLSYAANEGVSNIEEALSRIHIYQPLNIDSFSKILSSVELQAVEKKVSLIIVDSVASFARKEFSSNSNIQRAAVLASWAAELKEIAQRLNLFVVVTNQVKTCFVEECSTSSDDLLDDEIGGLNTVKHDFNHKAVAVPAMGNTWAHFVNTRFILQYAMDNIRQTPADTDSPALVKVLSEQLLIAKSPVAPFAIFDYCISSKGIDVNEDGVFSYKGIDPGQQKIQVQQGLLFE